MKNEIIEIRIDENGDIEVSVKGVPGSKCKDITRPIELALGSKVKDTDTEEMRGGKINNAYRNTI